MVGPPASSLCATHLTHSLGACVTNSGFRSQWIRWKAPPRSSCSWARSWMPLSNFASVNSLPPHHASLTPGSTPPWPTCAGHPPTSLSGSATPRRTSFLREALCTSPGWVTRSAQTPQWHGIWQVEHQPQPRHSVPFSPSLAAALSPEAVAFYTSGTSSTKPTTPPVHSTPTASTPALLLPSLKWVCLQQPLNAWVHVGGAVMLTDAMSELACQPCNKPPHAWADGTNHLCDSDSPPVHIHTHSHSSLTHTCHFVLSWPVFCLVFPQCCLTWVSSHDPRRAVVSLNLL